MIAVWDGSLMVEHITALSTHGRKSIPVLRIDPEERTIGYVSEEVPF